ncbi:hypothetical protein IGL98_003322 [Enterococcus sp. DIV0840]|uniref:LPXTG cell wall anchor domain-containing protein n=1 Tax=Enterococcus TaxID=1350 RepID=UPI001A8CF855|nr:MULTISPECIES: LPXTG cell wall anchor domain-containing protein [Enterococcus]MBO0435494.1 LPXTG cell wall anchor domain-containing protein [Enterococcus sp. DIV0849a]MBO0473361.1 LPXTG cell wall anchor domain-containing protein [Enterococcus ureasiticus]
MKKKSINCFLLTFVVCFGLGLSSFLTVDAEEIGQVQTSAGVGFYEDSTQSSSSIEPTATTSQSDVSEKPKGRYPSTGELVKKSLALSSIILILFVVLFILWKRKKNNQTKNGKEE